MAQRPVGVRQLLDDLGVEDFFQEREQLCDRLDGEVRRDGMITGGRVLHGHGSSIEAPPGWWGQPPGASADHLSGSEDARVGDHPVDRDVVFGIEGTSATSWKSNATATVTAGGAKDGKVRS